MKAHSFLTLPLLFSTALPISAPISIEAADPITSTEQLVAAVRDGAERSTIEIGAGTFELSAPLQPKAGMTLRGAGMEKTKKLSQNLRHENDVINSNSSGSLRFPMRSFRQNRKKHDDNSIVPWSDKFP